MVTLTDHTVPTDLSPLVSTKRPSADDCDVVVGGGGVARKKKKLKVNFNLTIDIRRDSDVDDACVPQGTNSLSDVSDVESLSEPIPTTPGGKPQVRFRCLGPQSRVWTPIHEAVLSLRMLHKVPSIADQMTNELPSNLIEVLP